MPSAPLSVRPLQDGDRPALARLLAARWGSTTVVSRGRARDASALAGVVAERDGAAVGFLTWRVDADGLEIVTLDALRPREGVGACLVEAAREEARARGCRRVWLVTTNDNRPAQAFYEAVGFERIAVHVGAVEAARRLKPEIPATGLGGVPLRDEIEYAWPSARGRGPPPESGRSGSTL